MVTTKQNAKAVYTPKEVAQKLNRHVNSIYKAIQRGALHADRLGDDGEYMIPLDELKRKLPGVFGPPE